MSDSNMVSHLMPVFCCAGGGYWKGLETCDNIRRGQWSLPLLHRPSKCSLKSTLCTQIHSLLRGVELQLKTSYVSLQNNLAPMNYSHNLMLSLDMLYKEVSTLNILNQSNMSGEYKWIIFFFLFPLFFIYLCIFRSRGCWSMLWRSSRYINWKQLRRTHWAVLCCKGLFCIHLVFLFRYCIMCLVRHQYIQSLQDPIFGDIFANFYKS